MEVVDTISKELRDFLYKTAKIVGIKTEDYNVEDERKDKVIVYDLQMQNITEHINTKKKLAEFHMVLRDKHNPHDLYYWKEQDTILTLQRESLALEIEYFGKRYFKDQVKQKQKYWEDYGKQLTIITNANIETLAIKLEEKLGLIKNQKQKILIIGLLKIYYDERPREQTTLNDLYLKMQDAFQSIQ